MSSRQHLLSLQQPEQGSSPELPAPLHLQLNIQDFPYEKDNSGNAVSKVLQIFQEETRITNVPAKQALDLVVYVMFVVTISR